MLTEFRIRPMQITYEGLQSIQFPEKIFRGCATIPEINQIEIIRQRTGAGQLRALVFVTYPLISHLSFSNPLCMDCAIDDSIKSTYLTTKGAKVSLKC